MDPIDTQSQKLLQDTFDLVQENNQMLHKVRSVQKWEAFWQGLKWLVIIGIALGSFYYIQPYMQKMLDLYNSISGTEQKLNSGSVQDLLKKLGN